jgi:putative salt-induced outer membrane protein
MIEAAANDPDTLDAVVRVAKKTNPDSIAEIDKQVAQLKARAEAQERRKAATQGFFQGWKGKGQAGVNISTGNTQQEGLALGLELEKDTPRWWHSIDATADVLREDNELTKERYFLALATHYKLTPRIYLVGVLWGESDRFAGYYYRFSEGVGLGYRLFNNPVFKLRFEGGPALREANYIETGPEQSGSLRAAEYLNWKFNSRNAFTQSVVAYLQSGNSTVIGATALTTKIYGDLAARASFEVRYESEPPTGRENTDTTSRVTLVYGF